MEFSSSRLYFIAQRAFELLKESPSMELEATPDDEVFSSNDEMQELKVAAQIGYHKSLRLGLLEFSHGSAPETWLWVSVA